MEGKCCKCEWMTKHKCLEKVIEDHENSSEEEKLIGKCENCDGSQVEIISVSQSGSSQTKKWQKTLEGFFCLKQKKKDEHSTTQQKPTDSKRMVTVDTVEKSCKNAVLAKYIGNDWLTYGRSGKYAINLKSLSCCRYLKHIDKLQSFKSKWPKSSTGNNLEL